MTDRPVNLNPSGPPETILDPEPAATESALEAALSRPTDEQRRAVADVVAANPRCLQAWAELGDRGRDQHRSS